MQTMPFARVCFTAFLRYLDRTVHVLRCALLSNVVESSQTAHVTPPDLVVLQALTVVNPAPPSLQVQGPAFCLRFHCLSSLKQCLSLRPHRCSFHRIYSRYHLYKHSVCDGRGFTSHQATTRRTFGSPKYLIARCRDGAVRARGVSART